MRRGFGILGLVLALVLIGVVGVIAYNAGWSNGFAQHLPEAGSTATPAAGYYPYPYYYGYGPHFFGFGWIFGLFFFLFFLWLIFRVIFGFGRWGRGWGYYRGMGMGPGHHGGGIPPAIDERMREWHTRVHTGQSGSETTTTPPPPPPPPAATA